jgi:hypothetical protein
MAQRRSRWLGWLTLAIAGVVVWQVVDRLIVQRSAPAHLVNHLWIERVPRNTRDMVWHFLAVEQDQRRVGVLGRASRWRVFSDGFVWKVEGDRLRGTFPQNNCHLDLQVRTWPCAGEAPKPFELCLELKGRDNQVYRYFSRRDWVVRPRGQLGPELSWLGPAIQTANATPSEDIPLPAPGIAAPAACWQTP